MKTHTIHYTAAVLLSCAGAAGCNAGISNDDSSSVRQDTEHHIEVMSPLRLRRIERTGPELAQRAAALGALVNDVSLQSAAPNEVQLWENDAFTWSQSFEDFDEPAWGRPFSAAPAVVAMYAREHDDLLVHNEDLLNSKPELILTIERELANEVNTSLRAYNGHRELGIGAQQARLVLEETLTALDSLNILNKSEYDADDAFMGELITGLGHEVDGEELTVEWVEEYGFYLNRKLNGISIYEAGIRIGVHRDGYISSVRVADLEASTAVDQQMHPPLRPVRPPVETGERIHDDLEAGVHGRIVHQEFTGYVLPPGMREAIVYPQRIVSFSDVYGTEVEPVLSRRQTWAFSLLEFNAPPMNIGPEPDLDGSNSDQE